MKSLELFMAYAVTDNCIANLSLYKNSMKRILLKENNRWVNGNTMTIDGFETDWEYKRGKARYYLNYSYSFSTYEYGGKVPEIGNNTANLGILYAFTNNIKLLG